MIFAMLVALALPLPQTPLEPPAELLSAAFSRLEAGDVAEAERLFRDITTEYPAHPDGYRGLALSYAGQNRLRDAVTVAFQVGARMQQAGDSESARALLELATTLAPDLAAARYFLGSALFDEGEFNAAVEQFRVAVDLGDAQLATRVSLAAALWEAGEIEAAEAEYRDALEANGPDPVALHQLATLLLDLGRYEEAAAVLAEAVGLAEPGPYLLLDQSRALAGAGRLEPAIEAARRAVAGAPEVAEAHYQLGTLLMRSGARDEAVEAMATVRRLSAEAEEQRRETFRLQAGLDAARSRLLAGAAEESLVLLGDMPELPQVLELRAAAQSTLGRHGEAADLLERLLDMEPGRREIEAWLVRERDRR